MMNIRRRTVGSSLKVDPHSLGKNQLNGNFPTMKRAMLYAALVAILSGVGALAPGAKATARTYRSDACEGRGCGSVTFTMVDRNTLRPVSLSVCDGRRDGVQVQIALQMEYTDRSVHFTPWTTARKYCADPENTVKNSYWEASGNVHNARAVLKFPGQSTDRRYGTWACRVSGCRP